MSNDEIENYIQDNIQWENLPHNIQQLLGSSTREYEKRILDYSVKHQLRYKGNLIRFVKKSAEEYYDLVLKYSLSKLMVYPYHLIDVFASGLRILPFEYYNTMIQSIMKEEKSFDSLPNFSAADCYRLLNIGRNEFIEMMNETRSYRKLFRRSKTLQEILPQKPANFQIETWYMLKPGCLLDNDVKSLNAEEKDIVDRLIVFPIMCGLLDIGVIYSLHARGLVYFDVPVSDDDYVYVPKLDGFIMNRVQGDYFENLLYKVFVTIDSQMNVKELADIIGIGNESVKNAISVLCRLGFVKKRSSGLENLTFHPSWQNLTPNTSMSTSISITDESVLTQSINDFTVSLINDDDDTLESSVSEESPLTVTSPGVPISTPFSDSSQRRIAFLFDSSLTAFLMMGNLSSNLKNHAVTLFEVGKLGDDSVENFIGELENINFFAEGEAQRYSEHALNLLKTIKIIRGLSENGIDLIRGESLMSLEERARQRIIEKSYRLLVSMAPISSEACAFSRLVSPHIGSPIVEMASPWFRMFIYDLVKAGPHSIFFPMGSCVNQIPFRSKRLILTTGSHEPNIILGENALSQLNDSLLTSSVIIQEYSDIVDDSEILNIAFPFLDTEEELQDSDHFCNHPSIKVLREKLNLDKLCGYITLMSRPKKAEISQQKTSNTESRETSSENQDPLSPDIEPERTSVISFRSSLSSTVTKDPKKIKSEKVRLSENESFDDFVIFDCVFGVPLFDENLNERICERLTSMELLSHNNMENILFAMRNIVESVQEFVVKNRDKNYKNPWQNDSNHIPLPMFSIEFDEKAGMASAGQNVRQTLGIFLLLIVNVVWVLSAEVTKYLFVDLNFKRPFFTTYIKSCLFSVFLIRYLICGPQAVGPKSETANYNKLDQSEDESFESQNLTQAEYELVQLPSDSDIDANLTPIKRQSTSSDDMPVKTKPTQKKVRFSLFREVRSLPEKIANEARMARLPYRPTAIECDFKMTPVLRYTFYFAPLWLSSSLTYQMALVFSSVSTVNLISASSSLFVLVLSAIFGAHASDRFSLTKLLLVIINLSGVFIVSQFSAKFIGVALSFMSALFYAIYLVVFSVISRRSGQVDISLMFGVIGLFSFVAFTPILLFVNQAEIEPQFPLPTQQQMLLIILNSLIGSIFSDYLWLYATLLTNSSLLSSISLTLTIPLSMVADFLIRNQFPTMDQLIASIPIMVSFIGASLLNSSQQNGHAKSDEFKMTPKNRLRDVIFSDRDDEAESLMNMEEEI